MFKLNKESLADISKVLYGLENWSDAEKEILANAICQIATTRNFVFVLSRFGQFNANQFCQKYVRKWLKIGNPGSKEFLDKLKTAAEKQWASERINR